MTIIIKYMISLCLIKKWTNPKLLLIKDYGIRKNNNNIDIHESLRSNLIKSEYPHDGKLTDLNDVKPKAYKYYYLVIPTQYEYVVNNSADSAEIIEIEDFKLLTHSENSFDQIFTSDIKNIVSDNS